MSWWYLSFAKTKADGGFQGAAVVQGADMKAAVQRAGDLGILAHVPGAEIAGWELDILNSPEALAKANRFIPPAEIRGIDSRNGAYDDAMARAQIVCKCCAGKIHRPN